MDFFFVCFEQCTHYVYFQLIFMCCGYYLLDSSGTILKAISRYNEVPEEYVILNEMHGKS